MKTLALLNNLPRRNDNNIVALTTPQETQSRALLGSALQQYVLNSQFAGNALSTRDALDYIDSLRNQQKKADYDARRAEADRLFSKAGSTPLARPNPNFLATGGDPLPSKSYRSKASLTIFEFDVIDSTANFILTSCSESDSERVAPVYTFGTQQCFTAGRRPRIFSYSGEFLINQKDGNSKDAFFSIYENSGRASSALIDQPAPRKAILRYAATEVEGVLTAFQANIVAQNPNCIPFGFSIFVYDVRRY